MMCAVYFGGRRAKLELRSGEILAGIIVSTNFGAERPEKQIDLNGKPKSARRIQKRDGSTSRP